MKVTKSAFWIKAIKEPLFLESLNKTSGKINYPNKLQL